MKKKRNLSKREKEVNKKERYILIDEIPANTLLINKNGKIIYANEGICNLAGYNIKELYSKELHELCLYYDREMFKKKLNLLNEQKKIILECVLLSKEKKSIPIKIVIKKIFLNNREYILCIIEDLSERKKIEVQLLHSNTFLKSIIDKAADGICVCNDISEYPYVRFTVWNEKMTEITGYTMEEINKLGWYQSVYPDADIQAKAIERMKRMREGDDIVKEEWRITCKNGSKKDLLISTSILASTDGKTHVMALMQDITEQKRIQEKKLQMQQQLLHLQKLESLGILAGGIAHDFNNILMAILGNLDLALLDIPKNSDLFYYIEQAMKATHRACELTQQMLAFSGKGRFISGNININNVIEKNLMILKTSIGKKIRLRLSLLKDLPLIYADTEQIQQILINLVLNASEAIGEKEGEIIIKTGCLYYCQEELDKNHLKDKLEEGEYVFIEVSDTGVGMNPGVINRLCEPFFTTKFIGRGLGMAAVAGIIKGHKGGLFIQSEPNKGTIVKVIFPISEKNLIQSKIWEIAEEKKETKQLLGTILIVDDEKIVRDVLIKMLEHIGFDTLVACNGMEAIDIFKKNKDKIECVLLDLTMPKMDGIATFRELIKIKPNVKVIMASGYNEQIAIESISEIKPCGFLQKPYKIEQLKELLFSVIS